MNYSFIFMFTSTLVAHFFTLSLILAKKNSERANIRNKSVATRNVFDVIHDVSVDNGNSALNLRKRLSEGLKKFGLVFKSDLANEDIYLNATELLRKNGYQVEEYEVETEDGYLLLLTRIRGAGPTIFLMLGIVLSSDDWVTAGPNIGIAYLLAELGYDVWMGNARGNKHSRKHKTLLPETAAFWDFSYHEIGYFDLRALVDFTLAVTKQFEHYAQTAASQRFAKFDYGEEKNLELYSSKLPPEYLTQNITTPIVFFYAEKDSFAPPEEVNKLRLNFSSVVETYKVPLNTFGHVDFLYAKDLRKLVFEKMLYFIKEYAK